MSEREVHNSASESTSSAKSQQKSSFERSALVIGMGLFGRTISRTLAEMGWFVLAVDTEERKLESVMAHVSAVKVIDGVEEDAIKGLEPSRFGVCICAIGDESIHAITLTVHNLKMFGARAIIGRKVNPQQDVILEKLGVDVLINPEQAYAKVLSLFLDEYGIEAQEQKQSSECTIDLSGQLKGQVEKDMSGKDELETSDQKSEPLYLKVISVGLQLSIWSILLSVISQQNIALEHARVGHAYPSNYVSFALVLIAIWVFYIALTTRVKR